MLKTKLIIPLKVLPDMFLVSLVMQTTYGKIPGDGMSVNLEFAKAQYMGNIICVLDKRPKTGGNRGCYTR